MCVCAHTVRVHHQDALMHTDCRTSLSAPMPYSTPYDPNLRMVSLHPMAYGAKVLWNTKQIHPLKASAYTGR